MAPQRRAPTVRWGTTVRAERRLATLATPRPIWTATRPAAYPASRVTVGWAGWGRRATRHMATTRAPTTTARVRWASWMRATPGPRSGRSTSRGEARPAWWPVTVEPTSLWRQRTAD